jgi:hypothetical protein
MDSRFRGNDVKKDGMVSRRKEWRREDGMTLRRMIDVGKDEMALEDGMTLRRMIDVGKNEMALEDGMTLRRMIDVGKDGMASGRRNDAAKDD